MYMDEEEEISSAMMFTEGGACVRGCELGRFILTKYNRARKAEKESIYEL